MKRLPVTFLVGPDTFQQRLYLEDLRREIFPDGSRGMNDDTFDAAERSCNELFDLANTMPMFSTHRLIVVRNFGAPNEHDQEAWLAYLGNPSPQTSLVVTAEKVDKRLKLFRTLEKGGSVISTVPPKPGELPSWLDRIARRHNVSLDVDARRTLIAAVGADLTRLDAEVEKLALYVHPETTIDAAAVDRLVLQTTGENVFAWTDQMVEGRLPEALSTLHHLLESGEPPLVLVSMAARHIRILIKARHHTEARTPRPEMVPALGVPPFLVGRYVEQARKLTPAQLTASLTDLQQLDRDLKTTGHPPHLLLEHMTRSIALRSR